LLRRKIFVAAALMLATIESFGQTSVQFGLTANPMLSWMKGEASEIEKGKMRGGFEFGLISDIEFTDNYILATGITMTIAGGNVDYTDSLLMRLYKNDTARFAGTTNVTFKKNYINIPLAFKMRTDEIGKLRYYGSIGVVPAFRFKGRVDVSNNGKQIYDNDNIVKKKDETDGLFLSNVFNLSLHVEGGIEFPFSDKTALVAGLFYRNGFVNTVEDGDDDKIALHNLGMRIGILF